MSWQNHRIFFFPVTRLHFTHSLDSRNFHIFFSPVNRRKKKYEKFYHCAYQELPTETSIKDFSCLNQTQKNAFNKKIVIFFFSKKKSYFLFPKKKIIFFFSTPRKKKIWYFHSLTRFCSEFLQKQSSTRKKNTALLHKSLSVKLD